MPSTCNSTPEMALQKRHRSGDRPAEMDEMCGRGAVAWVLSPLRRTRSKGPFCAFFGLFVPSPAFLPRVSSSRRVSRKGSGASRSSRSRSSPRIAGSRATQESSSDEGKSHHFRPNRRIHSLAFAVVSKVISAPFIHKFARMTKKPEHILILHY